ncbi:MAG: dihydrodipicolinate reductase [bacterium]
MKIVQYGCGKMSLYTMKFALKKGYEVVGAVDVNEDLIGKDISVILGTEDKNIKIVSVQDAETMLQSVKPDVCIITTMSLLSDCEEALMLCAKLGINAITTCEEAFYPFNSNPELTRKIDTLAKLNNCTITGSGYQDAFWGNLITTIAGATGEIKEIKGSSSYNVEDYGIALAQAHGSGYTTEEFEEKIASADNISVEERDELIAKGDFLPSYMWSVNGWLCDALGLTVVSQTQKCIPTYFDGDIHSTTLGMDIKRGMCTGMSAVVTTKTKEGINIESECIGKVYSENDFDRNNWSVIGEPNTNLVIERPDTVGLTCGTVVNRLEELVSAEAGFVPTSRFGKMTYKI